MRFFQLARPFIHAIPPETAHAIAIAALRAGLLPPSPQRLFPELQVNLWGIAFPNPVGMAPGFDKNAECIDGLLAQGFGYVETGTVTPLPQPGNPQPRMFRLKEDEAVINRLGFNNVGLAQYKANLLAAKKHGVVGVNIGKNKDTQNAVDDYRIGLEALYAHADYVTVNISSPNTAGLRDLQQKDALENLLGELLTLRAELHKQTGMFRPLLLKIAPDLTEADKENIAAVCMEKAIDGLIVSNTTVQRPPNLRGSARAEAGGLSGKPLFALSTEALRDMYRLTHGKIPLIGVGGIGSAQDAYAKIKAGASLVQLYSALVYQGFGLVERINRGLARLLQKDGLKNIAAAVGADAR